MAPSASEPDEVTDEEIDELVQRRDAGDDEARDAIDAWVRACLDRTVVMPGGEGGTSGKSDGD